MALAFLKHIFAKKTVAVPNKPLPKIRLTIVAFEDDCVTNSGYILSQHLSQNDLLEISYYNEPINKNFLDLQSRNFFDFIDSGKNILKKTNADILIWGYRKQNKIRLNFQTKNQYDEQVYLNFSILNSLYLPLEYFQDNKLNPTILNLILATILTAMRRTEDIPALRQIVAKINNSTPPKDLSSSYMPYILNLLALTYLHSIRTNLTFADVKITSSIFKNALSCCKNETKSIFTGIIYANFAQLYHLASETHVKDKYTNCKFAIDFYTLAQKYFNRHTYPYDFGYTAYKLSKLYFDYWKYTSDIQFLRNAVFQLREAQKVFTKIIFPKIWADIQKDLGLYLSMMAVFSHSIEIAKIAIENYQNYQTVFSKEKYPSEWAVAQESIGNIFFECGKIYQNEDYFEKAAAYYIDAANIYKFLSQETDIKRLERYIKKSDNYISNINSGE